MILLCWYQSGVRSKNEKSHNFIERALFALSDGGTSWSADVDEQSALAGWGMWSDQKMDAVPLTALKVSTIILNRMWATTAS